MCPIIMTRDGVHSVQPEASVAATNCLRNVGGRSVGIGVLMAAFAGTASFKGFTVGTDGIARAGFAPP
jgi:hypothetical protein